MVFLRGWSREDFKKLVGEDRPFWLLNSMIQTPGSTSSFPLPISTAQVRHHNCSPESRSMLHRLPSGQWRRESRTQARLECEAAQGISSMDESGTPVLTLQRSEQRRCFQSAISTSNLSTPSKASQLCLLLSRSLLQTFWGGGGGTLTGASTYGLGSRKSPSLGCQRTAPLWQKMSGCQEAAGSGVSGGKPQIGSYK